MATKQKGATGSASPKMQIEMVPVEKLSLFERNPRSISKRKFAALVDAVRGTGMIQNLVIDENNRVLGGHQRLRAAKKLKMTHVPCMRLDLKGDEKRAKLINLQLNNIQGEFDYDLLYKFIDDMDDPLLEAAGFEEVEELKKMVEAADADIEEAMEAEGQKTRVSFDASVASDRVKLKFGAFKADIKQEHFEKFMQLFDRAVARKLVTTEAGFVAFIIKAGIKAVKQESL